MRRGNSHRRGTPVPRAIDPKVLGTSLWGRTLECVASVQRFGNSPGTTEDPHARWARVTPGRDDYWHLDIPQPGRGVGFRPVRGPQGEPGLSSRESSPPPLPPRARPGSTPAPITLGPLPPRGRGAAGRLPKGPLGEPEGGAAPPPRRDDRSRPVPGPPAAPSTGADARRRRPAKTRPRTVRPPPLGPRPGTPAVRAETPRRAPGLADPRETARADPRPPRGPALLEWRQRGPDSRLAPPPPRPPPRSRRGAAGPARGGTTRTCARSTPASTTSTRPTATRGLHSPGPSPPPEPTRVGARPSSGRGRR